MGLADQGLLDIGAPVGLGTLGPPARRRRRGGLGPDMFAQLSWGYCQAVSPGGGFGWDGGLGTSWLVDPVRDLIVIVLTQRMWETSDPPPVHKEIQAAAYAAVP